MGFNTGTTSSAELLEEIKELVKDEGLTLTEFAEEMGFSRKAFSRFINGRTNTDFNTIVRLCKRLGIKAITIE